MSPTRFDPDPTMPHAICDTCGAVLATETDAEAHMAYTLAQVRGTPDARSHRIAVHNPTRRRRVEQGVDAWDERNN